MNNLSNTDFNFRHKLFQAEGACFSYAPGTKEPHLYVQMGENTAALTFKAIRANFGIDEDSEDSRLLDLVTSSLKFVKRIRPGDSIPNEVLDGTASWSVEDRHRQLVEIRLTVALAQWITGEHDGTIDNALLIKLAEDPDTKKRAQEGIDKIAEAMKLGKNKRKMVIDIISQLTDELSYIEALKEHFSKIKLVAVKLKKARSKMNEDQGLCDDIDRILTLIAGPISEYQSCFKSLESHTGDILNLVKSSKLQIQKIRETRDNLRSYFMEWEDIAQKWAVQTIDANCGLEALVRDTYRFVATNFPLTRTWRTG